MLLAQTISSVLMTLIGAVIGQRCIHPIALGAILPLLLAAQPAPRPLPEGLSRVMLEVPSSLDGSRQPSYLLVPATDSVSPRPLIVLLHTWAYDFEQRHLALEKEAATRNWLVLAPNFRGPNNHPDGCGSPAAQQDILDAVQWVMARYAVDQARIYLFGWSGGGHMALLMATRHPNVWAAASAAVPITDLVTFYEQHATDQFAADLRACFGGPPDTPERRARYRAQSPLSHMNRSTAVPLDLVVGVRDREVAPVHTYDAARAVGPGLISDDEFSMLMVRGTSTAPLPPAAPSAVDAGFKREILLRRTLGKHRFTAFDGGHAVFVESAIEWLSRHHR